VSAGRQPALGTLYLDTMRVAFVGKGGAGKSLIAGTFARLLAREGEPVLAVDSDPMPGLTFSLGIDLTDAGIPADAVVERPEGEEGPRFRLRPDLSPSEALRRYSATGPDGVRFLQFGKLRGHSSELMRSQAAFHSIVHDLPEEEWSLVGDLPGGTRQPFFGWTRFARTVFVVVEATPASLLSARRLARLAQMTEAPQVLAVANRVRTPDDEERVAVGTGLPVVAAVPYDEVVVDAECRGRPLLDYAPESASVAAVKSLLTRVQFEERAR
jgi:CO dehydrogenase maturation factor